MGNAYLGNVGAVLVEILEAKGAKVARYDPDFYTLNQIEVSMSIKKTLNEAAEGADCLVVLSSQEQVRRLNLKKLHALMKSPAALVDLAGIVDPSKLENEGFIYRGLGRGIDKK